tara:strand:+ start:124 stop:333 length:210 start_codon:yes stop_codon:yes gene_type:complete
MQSSPFPLSRCKKMTPSEFTRRALILNARASNLDLEYDDFEIYGCACGSDHWLAMNLMWLAKEYTESRR